MTRIQAKPFHCSYHKHAQDYQLISHLEFHTEVIAYTLNGLNKSDTWKTYFTIWRNIMNRSDKIALSSIAHRRDALKQLATYSAFSALWTPTLVAAQENRQYAQLNRYPRMVHEFFVRQARLAGRQSRQRYLDLKTKEDALQHVAETKARIEQSFGKLPEKTPLNARITGVVEREEYRIEKLIFESRPGFPVTANIYIPKGKPGPFPAVVGTCGHSRNGKAEAAYQSFSQGLARLGYICLIYDPIGQGERLQYPNENLTNSTVGIGVREHLHAGNQQFLVGEFFGTWRAWDGIRALDYLLTREDVDPTQIGVTGNSGGGTMTTWLCGVEDRWTMAAPSCFVTTFARNLENEDPADTEQCPPMVHALGLDHCDFLAAQAPDPVIILAKEKDFFDVRGAQEAYNRLKKLYRLLDTEENLALFVGPTPHGFSQENREAMYSWFNKATKSSSGVDDKQAFNGILTSAEHVRFTPEPELTIEKDETLWCTEKGQVAALEGTRTVFDFTQDKSKTLTQVRLRTKQGPLADRVRSTLKLPDQKMPRADYRIYRYLGSRGYPSKSATAYAVNTEPGIQTIVYRLTDERLASRPPVGNPPAILYVSHLSADEELRSEPLVKELIEENPKVPLFTCDVRGIGESMPNTASPNSFHSVYGNDYMYAIHSIMLDRPYVGQKTFDVLRTIDWLQQFGHSEVHLVGHGWGTLPATFAAILSPQVKQVTLKHPLTSYAELAETEDYAWPLSTLLPNVLQSFDLPECYESLAEKQLKVIEPWGARENGQ